MRAPNIYTDPVTLIGDSVTIAQNQWSAAVEVPLGVAASGEITSVLLYQWETGTGAILSDLYGRLAIFDSDPSLAAAATALTAAQTAKLVGELAWLNAELVTDATSGRLFGVTSIPFKPVTSLWASFFSMGATSINSAAGDDELVAVRLGIRRTW